MTALGRTIVALAIAVMGCNPGSQQTADGVTLLRWGHLEASPLGLGKGKVTLRGGCVGLEGGVLPTVVLWPPNTQFDVFDGALRVVVEGMPFNEGDAIALGGGEVSHQRATDLVGPIPVACQRDKYLLAADVARE